MGAKEDLIAKLHQRENAEHLRSQLLAEHNERFSAELPRLFRTLEEAVEGVPGITVERKEVSSGMDSRFPSLIIKFLGNTIQFDPQLENKHYVVRARKLRKQDLLFSPSADGSWTAEFMPDEHYTLDGEFVIQCLSQLLDEDTTRPVKLWD